MHEHAHFSSVNTDICIYFVFNFAGSAEFQGLYQLQVVSIWPNITKSRLSTAAFTGGHLIFLNLTQSSLCWDTQIYGGKISVAVP